MRGSGINKSHEHCGKVQDAYSLRCAAQVHGATREALRFVRHTVTIEANSATDNPMVFADTGDIVSCGNFHGAPIALAADLLACGHRPARDDQRAADGSAGQSDPERPAGVPHPRGRRAIGPHAGASHGGRDGVRAQDARASRPAWTRSRRRRTGKTTSA